MVPDLGVDIPPWTRMINLRVYKMMNKLGRKTLNESKDEKMILFLLFAS